MNINHMKYLKAKRIRVFTCCFLLHFTLSAQTTSISYALNGRPSNTSIEDSIGISKNPFAKFIGEWTLKNEDWTQNWGGKTETIKIPKHHTVSAQINTENSLLSIIDGSEPNGHIFWSYNPVTKEVDHLSSFGSLRAGKGKGTIDANGNLRLKLSFEGEAKDTYRIYTYTWIDKDTYALKSVQFDKNDQLTGLFYGGIFVRIKTPTSDKTKEDIKAILKVLDNKDIAIDDKMPLYTDDLVHMAPNNKAITSKAELSSYLKNQAVYGYSDMTHEIIDYEIINDIVVMQGQVTGTFHPSNGNSPIAFKTNNLFVFKRVNGDLKIWKIIYNRSKNTSSDGSIKSEIMYHGQEIRKAFSDGDIEKIKALHHPEVIKALGYNDLKTGRDAVIQGLRETLSNYNLEFIDNEIEAIFVKGDIAIEQTKFSIKGTPKKGGEPFVFSGRTMVTYIKYADSPTGWATIKEIIQPSN